MKKNALPVAEKTGVIGRIVEFDLIVYPNQSESVYGEAVRVKGYVIDKYISSESSEFTDQVYTNTFLLIRLENGDLEHVSMGRIKNIQ